MRVLIRSGIQVWVSDAKADPLSTLIRSTAGNMSSEDPASRTAQKQPLYRPPSSATYSFATPRPPILPPSHHPSLLRHASTPESPATTPLRAQFSIVLGSSPPKGFEYPARRSPQTTIKKRGRPSKDLQKGTSTPPTPAVQKKKGRPFKTPEAAAAAAAKAARSTTDRVPKKRGRPFKHPRVPEEIVDVVPPQPTFTPFICEWKDCPAELHNLDTLQGHLHIIHLRPQHSGGPFVCLWGQCRLKFRTVDSAATGASRTVEEGVEFKTKEALRNHVKVAHIDHVARYQGDGPKTEWGKYYVPSHNLAN